MTAALPRPADRRALDELATHLRREAKDLRFERSKLEQSVRALTWEGRGADGFGVRMRARLHDLEAVADDLDAAARQLE